MSIRPIIPISILIIVFLILFGLSGFLIIRSKTSTKDKIFSIIRIWLIFVLALVIGIRPVIPETEYEFETKNLDVLFVVDTTKSMWAEDYKGSKERMKGVQQDANYIIDELIGGNFGIVTFDNYVHVISPFTQDSVYIRNLFDTLDAPESSYSTGSDLSIAYKDVESFMLSSSRKENRKTIVFYISDGEITNGKPLGDYSRLKDYVSDGAVMGYGSAQGGKMKDRYGYVRDPETNKDALSCIDEDNLKQIAEQLGLEYVNMNSGNAGLENIVENIKESSKTVVESGKGAEIYKETYYYFAYPLILLLAIEMVIFARRGRL